MFHGSMVAMVTPMLEDGVIDIDGLRRLAQWHVDEGTDAIVVVGSTGEASTLNYDERKLVIQQTLEQVAGRIPVIAGTGTNSTASTIHLTRDAMELGVDACLLVAPYYNKPTPEGLYQHFKTVADTVPVPQILYNVPSRTASDLKPAIVARLAKLSNIIGLKDATGDIDRLKETILLVDGGMDFYSGDDSTCLEFMLSGGKGVISVTANVAPKLMHEMCLFALANDNIKAQALNDRMETLHKVLGIETNPIPVKWALDFMGMISSGIRLPLTLLSPEHHQLIKSSLSEAGLLSLMEVV